MMDANCDYHLITLETTADNYRFDSGENIWLSDTDFLLNVDTSISSN